MAHLLGAERTRSQEALSRRVVYACAVGLATLGAVWSGATFGLRRARGGTEGAALFQQRCALCHTTGGVSARGPGLGGVVGRSAGAAPGFPYSPALRNAGLIWDPATLDRFLLQPTTLVPGTAMPVSVPEPRDRAAIIAYLATLEANPPGDATAAGPSMASRADVAARSTADYRTDAPGTRHRLEATNLPPPYVTPSANNPPNLVDPPAGASLRVPASFVAERFASDLDGPRRLCVAPDGDIFVSESAAGRIRVLRPADGASAPEQVEVFATGLEVPFGVAFYPAGDDPRWIYVAEANAVVRFPHRAGDLRARGEAQTIIARLSDAAGGHTTRDITFSRDGTQLFVSVGSGSNVAEGEPRKSLAETTAWDDGRARGAAWGAEANRADVLVYNPEGGAGRIWATGLRNCVGLAVERATGDVWCSTNERDGLGDDLVPDFATRVREHAFFGWPWYYLGTHSDPRHAGQRPDLAGAVTVPDVLFASHSAPLQLAFYDGAMFPSEYRGDAFVAFHGSWNRAVRTGPKVVRIPMRHGAPTGDYEDFLTGFVVDDARVWGRPVGVAVAHDGALLVSEDGHGTIWRVATRKTTP